MYDEAANLWSESTNKPLPVDKLMHYTTWIEPLITIKNEVVKSHLLTPTAVARHLSVSTTESGLLYTGLPNSRDGTRLPDQALSIAVGLRLGLSVAAPGLCSCGSVLDAQGDHALSCNRGVGRGARHKELNDRVRMSLAEAGCVSQLEPAGLTRTDGKRPDGVTVLPFERGMPMAWDVTVIHTCAPSHLSVSVNAAGAAAAAAELKKDLKYAPIKNQAVFYPIAIETLGALGPSARDILHEIADRIQRISGDTDSRSRVLRRIEAAVQIGNAACILEAHSGAANHSGSASVLRGMGSRRLAIS